MSSLMLSGQVPRWISYAIVILIVASLFVFAKANSEVGTSIQATMRIHTYRTPRVNIFEFSLWTSVQNMWDAETYYLSILIAVWSGAWVYVKTVLLLLCWVLPLSMLSQTTRTSILRVLWLLAKWALCDVFLLVFFDVAFRFHVNVSQAPFVRRILPPDLITADLVVKPETACFSFITATLVVIMCINAVDHFNRNSTRLYWSEKNSMEDVVVLYHNFKPHRSNSKHPTSWCHPQRRRREGHLSRVFQYSLCVGLMLMLPIIAYAAVIESFGFRFRALAGHALQLIDPGSEVRSYSLISLIRDLSASSVVLDDETLDWRLGLGVAYMQSTTVMFALGFPILLVVFCIVLLLRPHSHARLRRLLMWARWTASLSSLDVFAVSVIVAVSQLEQFSLFLQVDIPQCTRLLHDTGLDCFRVKTELRLGCWLLVFTSFALLFASQTVFSLCEHVLEDIECEDAVLLGVLDDHHDDDTLERNEEIYNSVG